MQKFFEVLIQFPEVYIQGHDFPDTDSLASSFAIKEICDFVGVKSTIIYSGFPIDKPNLNSMIKELGINAKYVRKDFTLPEQALLVVVDAQHGAKNITSFKSDNIIIFDHHDFEKDWDESKYLYSDMQPKLGSCSTLIYQYLKEMNMTPSEQLANALLLGLYIDTNNLSVRTTELDREMSNEMSYLSSPNLISRILRTNYTLTDLNGLTEALSRKFIIGKSIVSFIGDYDNNLVGQLSDFLCEIEGTENVILVSEKSNVFRISVRSYGSSPANEIIAALVRHLGDGGGNNVKSAGVIEKAKFAEKFGCKPLQSYILEMVSNITMNSIHLDINKDVISNYKSLELFKPARKKRYNVRYLELYNLFKTTEGYSTVVTLEGAVQVPNTEILVIGPKGEIYPISRDIFESTYEIPTIGEQSALCDNYLDISGIVIMTKDNKVSLTRQQLLKCPVAVSLGQTEVLYYEEESSISITGKYGSLTSPDGAYVMVRPDGEYYLCNREIFKLTYEVIKTEEMTSEFLNRLEEGVV